MLYKLISILICISGSQAVFAQRQVTPVETDDKKPAAPTLHYYDKHGDPLDEPVLFLSQLDTVAPGKAGARPVYPTLYSIEAGLNFFDGIMMLAGQKHASPSLQVQLSLWNWILPTVEFGYGLSKRHTDTDYKLCEPLHGPFGKVGFDYNFLYKSNPDYRLYAGFRAACGKADGFPVESWGEVLLGIRVHLGANIALGWAGRMHFLFGKRDGRELPWFIPGYGADGSLFAGSFTVSYTIPFQ